MNEGQWIFATILAAVIICICLAWWSFLICMIIGVGIILLLGNQ